MLIATKTQVSFLSGVSKPVVSIPNDKEVGKTGTKLTFQLDASNGVFALYGKVKLFPMVEANVEGDNNGTMVPCVITGGSKSIRVALNDIAELFGGYDKLDGVWIDIWTVPTKNEKTGDIYGIYHASSVFDPKDYKRGKRDWSTLTSESAKRTKKAKGKGKAKKA